MAFETFKEMRNLGSINKGLSRDINEANNDFVANYNAATAWNETPSRGNFQTYPYDYYSGSNAKIFFGDIWVDDIVTLEYAVRQDKEPIYGYASQNFDAIARGVVIVQGTFSIAFKEMGYLNVVQSALESQRNRATASNVQRKINEKLGQAAEGTLAYDPRLARAVDSTEGQRTFNATGQPEIIRQQQTIEDILRYKKGTNIISSGIGEDFLGSSKERDFEDFAEVLEDTIWGDSNGRPQLGTPYKFRRADEFDYNWDSNNDLGGIAVAKKTKHGPDYSQVLNLLITFGDINDYRAEHTIVALNDVHIVSSSMVVSPTGAPIAETYMFIARDINQTLSKDTLKTLTPLKYNVGTGEEGFKTPKMEDIKAIEDFIAANDSNISIELQSLSKFYFSDTEKYDSWTPDRVYYKKMPFTQSLNPWDSKLNQIIKIVEQTINDPAGNFSVNDNTEFAQWLIEVKITQQDGDAKQEINMILDQQIPGTLTYRVISPTRDNFGSYSAFTRADMWDIGKGVPLDEQIDSKSAAKGTTAAGSEAPKDPASDPTGAGTGVGDDFNAGPDSVSEQTKQEAQHTDTANQSHGTQEQDLLKKEIERNNPQPPSLNWQGDLAQHESLNPTTEQTKQDGQKTDAPNQSPEYIPAEPAIPIGEERQAIEMQQTYDAIQEYAKNTPQYAIDAKRELSAPGTDVEPVYDPRRDQEARRQLEAGSIGVKTDGDVPARFDATKPGTVKALIAGGPVFRAYDVPPVATSAYDGWEDHSILGPHGQGDAADMRANTTDPQTASRIVQELNATYSRDYIPYRAQLVGAGSYIQHIHIEYSQELQDSIQAPYARFDNWIPGVP